MRADAFITIDTALGRFLNPFERIFGFILLGNSTIANLHNTAGGGNNSNNNTGG